MDNTLRELIELIKEEKVCLWVGSGMSYYAGYPSAKNLTKIIIEKLPESVKKELGDSAALDHVSDIFDDLNGRKSLRDIIAANFRVKPKSTYYHDLLSKISHFHTIITTNYDKLLEDAYTNRAIVIKKPSDRSFISGSLTTIYKIHGCVDQPSSIVVSKRDYDGMFNRNFRGDVWASIAHEIARYHHLFLGYGYEDNNIRADFETIVNRTVAANKKIFHLSPSISPTKQIEFNARNIKHIDMKGEDFIELLIENIKLNIKNDLRLQKVRLDTAKRFFDSFHLEGEFSFDAHGVNLISLRGKGNSTEEKVNFTITESGKAEAFQKFMKGKGPVYFQLDKSSISGLEHLIQGIKLHSLGDISELRVQHLPIQEGTCLLSFDTVDLEIDEVKYQLFFLANRYLLIANIYDVEIEIETENPKNFTFKYSENMNVKNLRKALCFFNFLLLLSEGQSFSIYLQNKKSLSGIRLAIHDATKYAKDRIFLFESMLKIERRFKKQFRAFNTDDLQKKDFLNIFKLRALIDNGYYAVKEKEGITFPEVVVTPELVKSLGSDEAKKFYLVLSLIQMEAHMILHQDFNLGDYEIVFLKPNINNQDIEKGELTIYSENDVVVYYYSAFGKTKLKERYALWEKGKN